jgi:hypothetical protein
LLPLLCESGAHVRFGEVGSVLWLLLLLCEGWSEAVMAVLSSGY